jgi:hypothetical protein
MFPKLEIGSIACPMGELDLPGGHFRLVDFADFHLRMKTNSASEMCFFLELQTLDKET